MPLSEILNIVQYRMGILDDRVGVRKAVEPAAEFVKGVSQKAAIAAAG
jgi:hypothetical protein